jgi:hypothetical protein
MLRRGYLDPKFLLGALLISVGHHGRTEQSGRFQSILGNKVGPDQELPLWRACGLSRQERLQLSKAIEETPLQMQVALREV